MNDQRIIDVVGVVAGKTSVDEVAARHGVAPAEVELWKQAYLAGLEGAVAGRRALSRRKWPVVVLGALLAVGLASRVSFASGSSCGETLPGTLTPFCPDEPALASVINQNYRALITLFESKVGVLTSTDIANTGTVSTNKVTLNSAALTAGSSATLANDSTTAAVVIAGRGTSPDRKIQLQDDVAVTDDLAVADDLSVGGDLALTGRLTSGSVPGTISGGGTLNCLLISGTSSGNALNCALFGGATCPGVPGTCSTSTRITCPTGSTGRETERNCSAGQTGFPYNCITTSWCIRD